MRERERERRERAQCHVWMLSESAIVYYVVAKGRVERCTPHISGEWTYTMFGDCPLMLLLLSYATHYNAMTECRFKNNMSF